MRVSLQERVRIKLQRLVEHGNVAHAVLGTRLKLSRSAVTRMITGTAAISLDHLEGLCEFFQITPSEFMIEPGDAIQPVKPLEAQLLGYFRGMNELQRHGLLTILDRKEVTPQKHRRAKLGRSELTEEQQLVVDLYARSEKPAQEGILKVLRGTARVRERAERSVSGETIE